jgi:predicted amidohydrolase YtcJ
MTKPLVIRGVEVDGRPGLDVRLEAGRIAAIGPSLASGGCDRLDGAGGALIPGLVDHHIHLLALGAEAQSVSLAGAATPAEIAARLCAAAAARPPGAWIRATGYHEGAAPLLSAADLDAVVPAHPVRVQHRSGALWILNGPALRQALARGPAPDCVEHDAGRPTGRVWRGDAWLAAQLGRTPPPLAPIGRTLAACGITAITDASATTDDEAAAILAAAHAAGDLPQRLTLMSAGALEPPPGVRTGPVKILLDEDRLPDFDDVLARIEDARAWGRAVAVHCVTAAELALTLAAFETAGAQDGPWAGDRIEHGSMIPRDAIATIRGLGLTVVTQPGFVRTRGDRYLAEVDPAEHADLYRLASLRAAGVPLAASSDAPYGRPDPWEAIAAAADRRTAAGRLLGPAEAVTPREALDLWLGDPADPGGPPRRVAVGAPADLCLLDRRLGAVLAQPAAERVAATIIAGRVVHTRAGAASLTEEAGA